MRCTWLPLLRVGLWPLVRLPSSWLWRLSGMLAWLFAGNALRSRREIARINLGLCFPALTADQRQRLLQANLKATVMGLFDSLRAWYAPSWCLRGIADIDGLENLATARKHGQGVVVLGSHMTSITLATRLLNEAIDEPVWIMKRPHNNACIEAELDFRRRSYCQQTLDKRDAPALLAALSEGQAVSMAADQDFNFQHAFLPFFGVPAATLVAVPSLARRSRAVVLPLWIRRKPNGRYELRIDPPLSMPASDGDIAVTARYFIALEDWVRAAAEQYLWVHRRFKTRPVGEAGFY